MSFNKGDKVKVISYNNSFDLELLNGDYKGLPKVGDVYTVFDSSTSFSKLEGFPFLFNNNDLQLIEN